MPRVSDGRPVNNNGRARFAGTNEGEIEATLLRCHSLRRLRCPRTQAIVCSPIRPLPSFQCWSDRVQTDHSANGETADPLGVNEMLYPERLPRHATLRKLRDRGRRKFQWVRLRTFVWCD